jgi:hypothetical protein
MPAATTGFCATCAWIRGYCGALCRWRRRWMASRSARYCHLGEARWLHRRCARGDAAIHYYAYRLCVLSGWYSGRTVHSRRGRSRVAINSAKIADLQSHLGVLRCPPKSIKDSRWLATCSRRSRPVPRGEHGREIDIHTKRSSSLQRLLSRTSLVHRLSETAGGQNDDRTAAVLCLLTASVAG